MTRFVIYMFPSYVSRRDELCPSCPKLWKALHERRRKIRWNVTHWNGFLSSLPDHPVAIFSSYANGHAPDRYGEAITPLRLRRWCDERGHFLFENELVTSPLGEVSGDVIIPRFDAFLDTLRHHPRKHPSSVSSSLPLSV